MESRFKKLRQEEKKQGVMEHIRKYAKEEILPKPGQPIEGSAPIEPEDVAAAIPAGGIVGKVGKVTRTAKPFAAMAERILIKGEKAAPRLMKAEPVIGKVSNELKKAFESKGKYLLFKGKK